MALGNLSDLTVQMDERDAYARIGPAYTATLPIRVIIATIGRVTIFLVPRDGVVAYHNQDGFLKQYSWECLPPK